ncbi:hypothetical protein MTO96_019305 [Rhipicephalus appendiculatus]
MAGAFKEKMASLSHYFEKEMKGGAEEAAVSKDEWRGYSTLFAQRMSSLLSEARQMLPRAKDVQERRWLQAFVHRLTQLAMDLERNTFSPWMPPVFSSVHESFTSARANSAHDGSDQPTSVPCTCTRNENDYTGQKRQTGFTSSAENLQKTFKQPDGHASVVGAGTSAARRQYKTSTVRPSSLRSSAAFVTWASGSGKSAAADESSSSVDDLVSQLERGKFPPDR